MTDLQDAHDHLARAFDIIEDADDTSPRTLLAAALVLAARLVLSARLSDKENGEEA